MGGYLTKIKNRISYIKDAFISDLSQNSSSKEQQLGNYLYESGEYKNYYIFRKSMADSSIYKNYLWFEEKLTNPVILSTLFILLLIMLYSYSGKMNASISNVVYVLIGAIVSILITIEFKRR